MKVIEIDFWIEQLPFSNIAPFVKIRNIQPVKLRAELCPFLQKKEDLRRSVWELGGSRYNMIKNIVLRQDRGRKD